MKLPPLVWILLMAAPPVCFSDNSGQPPLRTTPSKGEPWPAPQLSAMLDTDYIVDPFSIQFKATDKTCDDLDSAIARYQEILSGLSKLALTENKGKATPTEVELELSSDCSGGPLPSAGMDESYNISINTPEAADRAIIRADTIWGMYRGMETFTHLIYLSDEDGMFHLRQGAISDFPRYTHRGLMIDTSRHFLSVPTIKKNIDLMAFSKFNVLHWHLVDDQSFPFVSETFPEMSAKGAYTERLTYPVIDVADVIEYARQRGIRVIPEFDTPGHVQSWGAAHTELLTACYGSDGKPNGAYGPLDPTKQSTYDFVTALFTEVTNRFPDKYIHLGGDEVSFGFSCWLSNPDIQAWMKQLNITTAQQVENEYIKRLLKIVVDLPSKPGYVIWQEVIDNDIPVLPDTIVEVWKGGWENEMAKATALGHRAILSTPWYLNYINYGADWPNYYKIEPESFDGNDTQKQLVFGGEACMWAEFVDDTNFIPRTWPRASAVAERLWSAKEVNDHDAAAPRIEEHRCRVLSRGYAAEPPNGPGFCREQGMS